MQATVPIVIYPLVILADRPERCELNATLNYTGNSTRRWLYSSLTDPQLLASCDTCYKRRIQQYFEDRKSTRLNSSHP